LGPLRPERAAAATEEVSLSREKLGLFETLLSDDLCDPVTPKTRESVFVSSYSVGKAGSSAKRLEKVMLIKYAPSAPAAAEGSRTLSTRAKTDSTVHASCHSSSEVGHQ